MNLRLSVIFILTIEAGTSFASGTLSELKIALHQASENIEQYSDYEKINSSLYEQIRPRANITINELSQSDVDQKVRDYVERRYVPVLIDNYSIIYSELREANKDFTVCHNPVPIDPESDILKALCIEQTDEIVKVKYMTNGYSQGWSNTLVFVFHQMSKEVKLEAIALQLKEGVKAHVPGI